MDYRKRRNLALPDHKLYLPGEQPEPEPEEEIKVEKPSKQNSSNTSTGDYNSRWQDKIDQLLHQIEGRPDFQFDEAPLDPYHSDWQGKVDSALAAIKDRPKFNFDLKSDPIWKALSEQYVVGGQKAMADTMAKASAMTGGYLNSHAQGASQQAYQGYLQKLSGHVPGIVGIAQGRYDQEGADLKDKLRFAIGMEDKDYNRYKQKENDWNRRRQEAKGDYDREGMDLQQLLNLYQQQDSEDYRKYLADRQAAEAEAERQKAAQEAAYSKLHDLIVNSGYTPSEDELKAAGMSQATAQSLLDERNRLLAQEQEDRDREEQRYREEQAYREHRDEVDDAYRDAQLQAQANRGGGNYYYEDGGSSYDGPSYSYDPADDPMAYPHGQGGMIQESYEQNYISDFEAGYNYLRDNGASDAALREYVIDQVAKHGVSYEEAYRVSGMYGG